MTLSNIQSINTKIVIAAINNAIAERIICHLNTSRWSIKLISALTPSSCPLIFLKNDFLFVASTLNLKFCKANYAKIMVRDVR